MKTLLILLAAVAVSAGLLFGAIVMPGKAAKKSPPRDAKGRFVKRVKEPEIATTLVVSQGELIDAPVTRGGMGTAGGGHGYAGFARPTPRPLSGMEFLKKQQH
jgi:hypothetical protein